MAYVNFSTDPMLAYAGSPRHDVVAAPETGLSPLEWSVVALARRDRIGSLAQPGRVSIALGKLFGTWQKNPRLADARLEALRRMAVLSWHRGFAVPASELRAFLGAGFSAAHYETLLVSISAARLRRAARA